MFERIKSFFSQPKLRVRRLDLETGHYVEGTVEKTTHTRRAHAPDVMTYWTVVWDDSPGVWITVPSFSFLWHNDFWTLIER